MLTLWNGFDRAMNDELRRMDRLFAREPQKARYGRTSWPRVNVLETEVALVVSAEVPGFTPDQVNVTVHDGVLTIEGAASEEKREEGELLYGEHRQLSFKRTFTLNAEVNVDTITAVVRDGLLTVTLPKAEAAKPRQIEVKAAS